MQSLACLVIDNAEVRVFGGEPRVCFHLDQKVMNSLDKNLSYLYFVRITVSH